MVELNLEQIAAKKRCKEALEWLKTTFPKTFLNYCPVPLKISIHREIFALNLVDAPPKRLIRKVLGFYANSPSYLSSLVAKAPRIDLNGDQVGEVTEQEGLNSLAKSKKYKEKAHLIWLEKKKLQRQEAKKRKAEQRAAAKLKKTQINEIILPELTVEEPTTEEIPKPAKFAKVLTLKKKTTTTEIAT